MSKPLVIDLCAGLGGWTKGFLAEGWNAIGFDIERHEYGEKRYPAELILKSILDLNGYDLRAVNPALVVASPPCQKYSYMAMPWTRAKREIDWQRWERDSPFGDFRLNDLFDACFRIAREIGCPIVLENVCGAQPWVGRANAHFGSYYLWGDVADVGGKVVRADRPQFGEWTRAKRRTLKRENGLGSSPSFNGGEHETRGVKGGGDWFSDPTNPFRYPGNNGTKFEGASGAAWFDLGPAAHGSQTSSRKAASAMIAEIPFELASYIARAFKPMPPLTGDTPSRHNRFDLGTPQHLVE